MNRKQAVVAVVAVIIGFILGFFTARISDRNAPPNPSTAVASGGVPADHPTPETMQRLGRLQQQARNEPGNRAIRVELGNAYYDMNRFDSAVTWYEEALALGPDDPNVNTDLGTARLYLGEVDEAIRLYQRSLEIEQSHPQTLYNLGIAHYLSGRYAEAIGYWEQLLAAHPAYPDADAIREQIASARSRAGQP